MHCSVSGGFQRGHYQRQALNMHQRPGHHPRIQAYAHQLVPRGVHQVVLVHTRGAQQDARPKAGWWRDLKNAAPPSFSWRLLSPLCRFFRYCRHHFLHFTNQPCITAATTSGFRRVVRVNRHALTDKQRHQALAFGGGKVLLACDCSNWVQNDIQRLCTCNHLVRIHVFCVKPEAEPAHW